MRLLARLHGRLRFALQILLSSKKPRNRVSEKWLAAHIHAEGQKGH
jgi:hypothetical protein